MKKMNIGREIARARTKAGLSQNKLGQMAGLAQGYISMIERGLRTPSLDVLATIAQACDAELNITITLKESGS